MKNMGLKIFLLIAISLAVSSCAVKSKRFTNSKNTEFVAMLADPALRKEFRQLKAVAMNASLYQQNGRVYFSAADTKMMNAISSNLVYRLQHEYHLTASGYKIHTFIAKSTPNSCYQYYNSYAASYIGKVCSEFSRSFASCDECNAYIKAIRTRKFSVMHATWWNGDKTIDLVDTFKLRNGDYVYMGLEIVIG